MCTWGTIDCKWEGTPRCDTCFTDRQSYVPLRKTKKEKPRPVQRSRRAGSSFEVANHNRNVEALKDTISNMTINSGATMKEKGDENLSGYVKISEELKTQLDMRAKGHKTFTLQKEWLEKLKRESREKDQEFWYLVFSFSETEGIIGESYAVIEKEQLLSMIKSLIEDRKERDLAVKITSLKQKEIESLRAEISSLHSKISLLEEKTKLLDDDIVKQIIGR